MKNLLSVLLMLVCCVGTAFAKGDASAVLPYEIYGAGTGVQGTYIVEVVVTAKKADVSDQELVKSAVHGVLFKGFVNEEMRLNQKPLAGSALAEQQHADFYKEFFATSYKNYGQAVGTSRRVTKVKKEYKVKMTVTVYKDQLRKDLESVGVIAGLNSGF